MRVTTHVHPVPRIRMCGAIPLLPYIPSWLGQWEVYCNFSSLTHHTHVSCSLGLMRLLAHNAVRSAYFCFLTAMVM